MKIPKVYLETTMFNFFFAEKGRQYFGKTIEYCQEVKRLFEEIKAGKFKAYTSEYVIKEIRLEVNEEHRMKMLNIITDYDVVILSDSKENERLAHLYIQAEAIPKNSLYDALHIATSAVNDLDFIVSLNFQHIVKDKARRITAQINKREGYKEVGIFEPKEVINHEEEY
jgi:predicted nucleic acid-binding protein